MRDNRLVRELVWIVAVKLMLIVLLWWAFVRDARIEVTSASVASEMTQQNQGATQHDQ